MPLFVNRLLWAIKECLVYVIICFSAFIFFFVFGFIIARGNEDGILIDNASAFINLIFSTELVAVKYFFVKILAGAGVLIIIALSGKFVWLVFFHLLIIVYLSLMQGAALYAFYSSFSVMGISVYALMIFPSFLVRICSIISLSACGVSCYKTRRDCLEKYNFRVICECFLIAFLIYAVAVLYETLMIYLILRPVSVYF